MIFFRRKTKFGKHKACKRKRFTVFPRTDGITPNQCFIELNQDEELYVNTCVQCAHLVGDDNVCGIKKNALIAYLNRVFKIDDERYCMLLNIIKAREPPAVLLKVDIKEAKNLPPMDANGLSDPFCVMWLSSKQCEWVKSSIIHETLSPVWNESYCLSTKSTKYDALNLSVWDSDAIESIVEIMRKIMEIKTSYWALKKCLKELKQATAKKHCNEFIGSIQIPFKTIPTSGQMKWFKLQKPKDPSLDVGQILLKFSFGSEKDNNKTFHEHERLLDKIAREHVETFTNEKNNKWSGQLCEEAEIIARQHAIRCNLTEGQRLLIKWMIYADLYQRDQLDVAIVEDTLEDLMRCQCSEQFTEQMTGLFRESMKKHLSHCFQFIKQLGQLKQRSDTAAELRSILNILVTLQRYKQFNEDVLLRENAYDWFIDEEKFTLKHILQCIIISGACNWLTTLFDDKTEDDLDGLKANINAIASINEDLQSSLRYHENIFNKCVRCPYSKVLFDVYQYLVSDAMKPIILTTLRMIRQIILIDQNMNTNVNCYLLQRSVAVYELYLELEKFYNIGIEIFGTERKLESLKIFQFREWFLPGVTRWLDITIQKARQWIAKAVDLEEFVAVDDFVRHTSSAVDIMFIFHEMKISWGQMRLLKNEIHSSIFLAKMIETITECSIYYSDKLDSKLNTNPCQTVDQWCFAVNNVSYILKQIRLFLTELECEYNNRKHLTDNGKNDHPDDLGGDDGSVATQMENLILPFTNKLLTRVEEKRNELLETLTWKTLSYTVDLLNESANSLHINSDKLDAIMNYLENKLIYLNEKLDNENFEYVLYVMWKTLYKVLYNSMKFGINNGKPPKFFSNLRGIFNVFGEYFKLYVSEQEILESLRKMEAEMHFHEMETAQLVYRYYEQRHKEQNAIDKAKDGVLAVRVIRDADNDSLVIEVLNARNLKPTDSNGLCDPFVTVRLLSSDVISNGCFKTKVQQKTLFPLFDEKFTISLTSGQQKLREAMIMCTVEDEDFFHNDYVGECYLSLEEINQLNGRQVLLNLYRPSFFDSEAFAVLCNRQNDKTAREFIKIEKTKMTQIHHN